MNILVNNIVVDVTTFDLPVLISAKCGGGASFFSIAFIAKLIQSGQNVIYFCKAQAGLDQLSNFVETEALKERVKVIKPNNQVLLKQELQKKDIGQFVIFIKNIEDTLDSELFELIKGAKGYILSGDVDLCSAVSEVERFATPIFFTDSQKFKVKLSPGIEKYQGEIQNIQKSIVETKIN